MKAISKTVRTACAAVLLTATVSAQAGMTCPAMAMLSGAGVPSCAARGEAEGTGQSCPVRDEAGGRAAGCAGNEGLAGRMGDMAAGGMQVAMAVMGALFGSPTK